MRLIKNVIKILNKDSAMIMIRSFYRKGLFKNPRWHTDGRYYKTNEPVYKFVMTLKGDTTLFYKKNNEEFHKKVNEKEEELIKKNFKFNKDDIYGYKYRMTEEYKKKIAKMFKQKNYLKLKSRS